MKNIFRKAVIALALLVAMPGISRADEGMWLLNLIGKNYADFQKAGLKLTAEDIYSINQSCIKDAIVGLGNDGRYFWHFCTGEIISDQGLVSTNHHCGYGKIQEHSTVAHDYLRDGFWAYTKDQELPNPGLTASILVRVDDVTTDVKAMLNDNMTEDERAEAIAKVSEVLVAKGKETNPGCEASVRPMFNGNQFFLFIHRIYKDVRLVGAPPSSMGKFGGDTDNWMWPRHTCDFSLFRIYTAPDGSPAAYSAENIPLKPKHHLPVNIKGIQDGDYAMVMGFPGTTDRFLTSYGLEETMNITNKLVYEIRSVKIDVLRKQMASSQATRIKYASKYASCSNYWKNAHEANIALNKLNTMAVKQGVEAEFLQWARNKDSKYPMALKRIQKGYADRSVSQSALMYVREGLLSGPELPWQGYRMGRTLVASYEKVGDKPDMIKHVNENTIKAMAAFYKDYDVATEKMLIAALYEYVYNNIDKQFMPQFLVDANKKYKGDWTKYAETMVEKSIFRDQATFEKFMANPNMKAIQKDPIFLCGQAVYEAYSTISNIVPKESKDELERGKRDFVDGILQMNEGKRFMAPDANSTIRCTYGNVKSYRPRNAVAYDYYTTLEGVIEKQGPAGGEFEVPDRLVELYKNKDFGQYANAEGQLPTCFISTNDITGGNSGSPVMDAEGRLIGLAFDGNSEAMSGDIDFEENLQRCICLDVRYMLWVIDKYAGAKNLIDEMTIVK
ncbi:MAG: S46 family peptidase [Bacteroidales bacterium]|nr:S46 family peptidase [Candidatus Colimorpha merdihippi]MCQ2283151.1 S46 family peptidase [Bacteroidales bacterium]